MTSPDVLLLSWLGASMLVLLSEHPMWRPHVSHLVPGLALLAARHRPPWRVLAVAALVVLPYYVVHAEPILAPGGYSESEQEAIDALRALRDDALAISDEPGLVWRAGLRTPPELVDASVLRMETGEITSAYVADAAAAEDVCGVVVRSDARWGSFGDLESRLQLVGYLLATEDDQGRRVYLRPDCLERPITPALVDPSGRGGASRGWRR
jgi:hypothetical protein